MFTLVDLLNKIFVLQGGRLFFIKKRVNHLFENIKNFFYAFWEFYSLYDKKISPYD